MNAKDFVKSMFLGNPAQSGLQQKAKQVQPIAITEMFDRLQRLSDAEWALYAFSREPLRGKFSTAEKLEMADASRRSAIRQVEVLRKTYEDTRPQQLARKMGLEVKRVGLPGGGSQVLFAQYAPPRSITLFVDCIERAIETLQEFEMPPTTPGQIEEVLLAHELFHHIEHEHPDIYTQAHRVELWKLGPVANRSRVVCLSEIAGMAFAQELTGFAVSPYILDVLLVYGYSKAAATSLYQSILRIVSEP